MLSNSWQTAVRVKAMATLATLMRAMTRRSTNHMPSNQPLPSLRRAFSLYDQINLINNVPEDQLRFQQFTDTGFRVNGAHYEGSLLCVGNLLMSWQPKNLSEVTPESLSIFQTVRPVPEILLLGCGKYIQPVNPELRAFIRSTGMKLEAIDSRNAASTYNILNEEGRIVAAALLPYGIES
ncbi:NADH dehydrogenase [Capsicum galapagoense]